MNNPMFLPLVLQAVGVIVIIAELVLPSGGILSVIALGVFGYSLYSVFTEVSPQAGLMFVGADIIIVPLSVLLGIKLLARSPVALSTDLSSKDGVVAQDESMAELQGKIGTVISDLRPAGRAQIEGHRIDVVSSGDFIEKGAEVIVSEVSGNRVVVKPHPRSSE
jgi:membrane-bound ClpP family serine protease